MIYTSEHFTNRVKERCGLHKKLSKSFLEKALKDGITLDDCKQRPFLYNYLISMCKSNRHTVIYNRYLIIFQHVNNDDIIGVTVLHLLKKYYASYESLKRRKING